MKTLSEIKSTLARNRSKLFSEYPIESLAIFGSYARNDANNRSDLDLLVEFNDKIGVKFIDLAYELEELMDLKVDLVSKKGVKEKYLKAIEQDLIYV
jgi:predicted nucleotidyltransferase